MAQADKTLFQGTFHEGIVRDVARHAAPAGGVYDALDFLLERPGVAYKRGGWARQSAEPTGPEGDLPDAMVAVGTLDFPRRVVAVGDNGTLYNVTGGDLGLEALVVGDCHAPRSIPPTYVDRIIFCDPNGSAGPKKAWWDDDDLEMKVGDLGGSPPAARHAIVHAGRLVLANRGDTDKHLVWFSPLPDIESTWDTDEAYLSATYGVTGLASVQGVLLLFSDGAIERVLGHVPPGTTGENMILQPAASVGCTDARSIAGYGGEIIFANPEGVFATNGAGARLLSKPVGPLWQSLFPYDVVRHVAGGVLAQEFYVVSVRDDDAEGEETVTLMCHLPTGAWTRLGNVPGAMFVSGRTEEGNQDLYWGSAEEPYVNRLAGILDPGASNEADADGTDVEPSLEVTLGDAASLKKYGRGRVSYRMAADGEGAPTLAVSTAAGVVPGSFTARATVAASSTVKRSPFDVLHENTQAASVKVVQSGASSYTEVYGVEADHRPYEAAVTGGQ